MEEANEEEEEGKEEEEEERRKSVFLKLGNKRSNEIDRSDS